MVNSTRPNAMETRPPRMSMVRVPAVWWPKPAKVGPWFGRETGSGCRLVHNAAASRKTRVEVRRNDAAFAGLVVDEFVDFGAC